MFTKPVSWTGKLRPESEKKLKRARKSSSNIGIFSRRDKCGAGDSQTTPDRGRAGSGPRSGKSEQKSDALSDIAFIVQLSKTRFNHPAARNPLQSFGCREPTSTIRLTGNRFNRSVVGTRFNRSAVRNPPQSFGCREPASTIRLFRTRFNHSAVGKPLQSSGCSAQAESSNGGRMRVIRIPPTR